MQYDNDVVIAGAARSAFSRFGGTLKNMHSIDIAAQVMRGTADKIKLDKKNIDIIYYGMCILSEAAIENNINGRQAMLKAGFPSDVLSLTIDRACCSSLTAVHLGFKDIKLGEAEVVMAVGAENMSNTPFVVHNVRWATGLQQPKIKDHLFPITYSGFNILALDAGEVALENGITRKEQDLWAYRSQMRYQRAKADGKFSDEIIPIKVPRPRGKHLMFDEDEFPQPDTTLEKLESLKTLGDSLTVTPGNAPGLDAGACAVIITSRKKAAKLGLSPMARIVSIASVATNPRDYAKVPAFSIIKALNKADFKIDDMDKIEINEAFAAVPLISTKILAGEDTKKIEGIRKKTNVNGGAIAVGHPVGASGARILMTLVYELKRTGGRYGVCAICGGLAQGDAVIIEAE